MYNMVISFINMTSLNKIKKYFDTGFYNKAITYFSELDETNPSPQVLNVVAACYFRLGEYHTADIVLQQAEPPCPIIQVIYPYTRQTLVY